MQQNQLHLSGVVDAPLQEAYQIYGERFFKTYLVVPRLSGQADRLPLTLPERVLPGQPIGVGQRITVAGQLRSYNQQDERGRHLILTGFVSELTLGEGIGDPNRLRLTGVLCKKPVYRTTPMGRQIADLLLAVGRSFGKSDYIPLIAWGKTACYAAGLAVGQRIAVTGRMQSRAYEKQQPDGSLQTHIAYEGSVAQLTALDAMHEGKTVLK